MLPWGVIPGSRRNLSKTKASEGVTLQAFLVFGGFAASIINTSRVASRLSFWSEVWRVRFVMVFSFSHELAEFVISSSRECRSKTPTAPGR